VEHPVLNEAMIEIEMSMAIGEFPEWLYARTYMEISSNYPDICPQEMGIKVGCGALRNQEKMKF
jgi:hypothetical protein